jgi:hypothetical protein
MRAALVACALASCKAEPTSVELVVALPAGVERPVKLCVAAFGNGLIPSAAPADGCVTLRDGDTAPFTIGIELPDGAPSPRFRVRVDGRALDGSLRSQAADHIPLVEGARVEHLLTLTAGALPDCDGDGVPDVIDECPGANARDDCAAGMSGACDGGRDL